LQEVKNYLRLSFTMVAKAAVVAILLGIGAIVCLAVVLPLVLVMPQKDGDKEVLVQSESR